GVMNLQVVALADQMLGNDDNGAFSQIVCASLECQSIEANPADAIVRRHVDGPLEMGVVTGQKAAKQGQIHVVTAGQVEDHPHVLGQAGTAKSESGPQV